MTARRWQKIKEILSQAVTFERSFAKRAYLDGACRSSPSLRAEVDSLLRHHEDDRGPLAAFASLTGQHLSHYQLLEKVGTGATGVVYKARDTLLDRFVVIKVLPPLLMPDDELRRRFEQEAKCLSALNHPRIATIYEFAQDKGLSFIVMEYVPGRTLAETISPGGFPVPLCLDYGIQIADALAAAHVAGIIHRDLKPSNVLITDEGSVKILDFGMARVVKNAPSESLRPLTITGTILGTAGYMSPEQARGNNADVRSDVFCLGAVLHEMLAGVPPFKRDSSIETMAAILKDDPSVPAKPVPPQVLRILRRCLQKDPAERFQTMQDVLSALRAASLAKAPRRRAGHRRSNLLKTVVGKRILALTVILILAFALRSALRTPGSSPSPVRAQSSASQAKAVRTIVVVAPFAGDESTWVTRSILDQLKEATQEDADIEIRPLDKPITWNGDTAPLPGDDARKQASLMIWGETKFMRERTIVTAHLAILDQDAGFHVRHRIDTTTISITGRDTVILEERLSSEFKYVALLAAGVKRYKAHNFDGSIRALTRVIEEPLGPNDIVDSAVSRFYRGLAYEEKVDAGGCLSTRTSGCDLPGTIAELKWGMEDFDVVLRSQPDHAGSFWHRGLAYAKLCELQSHANDPQEVPSACARAIADFDEALKPHPLSDDFFRDLPDEANILWNRALTHAFQSRLKILTRAARLAEFTNAIRDFDQILAGGARYATFLNGRRQDILRHRRTAESERVLLASKPEL